MAEREEAEELQRLDPAGCGCTDCLVGYSKPWDAATDHERLSCARGELDNATGLELRVEIVERVIVG